MIDGDKEYKYIKPGDVICLQAGEHGNLKIRNLDGTAENPITIINYQGKVIITGSVNLSGGIHINNSSYLRLTGTGVSSECGSEFSTEEQNCGIEIFDTWKGVKLDSKEYLHHIEIDHISIHDTTTETLTRGIAFHPRPSQFIDTIYIHHNYVARTTGEGIYIGSEPNEKPFEELAKLTNVEISYNLVESIGFDGIKTKVVIGSLLIHHNIVLDTGLSNTPAHRGGIKMAMSNGLIFNNYVENSFEGIRMGRALDGANSQYYNNIVVNMSDVGISTKERNASIYNNTVINGGLSGIRAEGKSPLVYNNLVIGTTALAIIGPSGSVNNNLVANELQARFVDFAGGDFHLLPDSPAVDAGMDHPDLPDIDFDENPRSVGRAVDIGAYEYNPDLQSSFNGPGFQEQIAQVYQRDQYHGPRIKEFFD